MIQLLKGIPIELAAFSIENSNEKAAISIEIRSEFKPKQSAAGSDVRNRRREQKGRDVGS